MRCVLCRLLCCSMLLAACAVSTIQAENWPGWRGPRGDGTSFEKNVPTSWDAAKRKNLVWKTALPGEGHASPVVWNDRIFIAACLKDKQERVLLCLESESGKLLWSRSVFKAPLETKHSLNSHASGTPATDGELVYVTFLEVDGSTVPAPNVGRKRPVTPGRMVVAAYDFDGRLKWEQKPGSFVSAHGFCSCPVLYEDLVIVNGDHDGESYILALVGVAAVESARFRHRQAPHGGRQTVWRRRRNVVVAGTVGACH